MKICSRNNVVVGKQTKLINNNIQSKGFKPFSEYLINEIGKIKVKNAKKD